MSSKKTFLSSSPTKKFTGSSSPVSTPKTSKNSKPITPKLSGPLLVKDIPSLDCQRLAIPMNGLKDLIPYKLREVTLQNVFKPKLIKS